MGFSVCTNNRAKIQKETRKNINALHFLSLTYSEHDKYVCVNPCANIDNIEINDFVGLRINIVSIPFSAVD